MPSAFHSQTADDIRARLPVALAQVESAAKFAEKLKRRLAHLEGYATEPFVPQHGSITASCGHRVADDEMEVLTTADYEDGDRTLSSGCYCVWCALHTKVSGYLLESDDAQRRWAGSAWADID